jgi:hypothetical protein
MSPVRFSCLFGHFPTPESSKDGQDGFPNPEKPLFKSINEKRGKTVNLNPTFSEAETNSPRNCPAAHLLTHWICAIPFSTSFKEKNDIC